jgi:acyl-CoA hydrolase
MFTKLPLHYHHIPTDCLKIFVCINTHTKRDREIERERARAREREKERESERKREKKRERCHYLGLLRGSQKIKKFL